MEIDTESKQQTERSATGTVQVAPYQTGTEPRSWLPWVLLVAAIVAVGIVGALLINNQPPSNPGNTTPGSAQPQPNQPGPNY